jgi:hypothetical protein
MEGEKMKNKLLLAILAVLLCAGPAFSQTAGPTPAPSNSNSRGKTFEICTAVSVNGTCDSVGDGTGTDLFMQVSKYRQFTVYFEQSGTNATCEIYLGDQDLSNNLTDFLTATDGTKINSTSLSSAAAAQSFEGPFYILWVDCLAGTGTHTVTIQAAE